jgi:ATP-dependent DNA helicase DinG
MTPAAFIDDPDWARIFPEDGERAKTRHLPTHEDCSSIDPDSCAAHLSPGGTLGGMGGYEMRKGQNDMLKAIARAYNSREHLMIEAGTGVGKSLAYLIPSIVWSWTNDTPVVVSTATRNLQSQLVDSDIPKALAVLGENAGAFKTALLKGRGNYLCLRSVSEFFSAGYWTMSKDEQDEMPHFIEWMKTTADGDLDSYEGLPRALISRSGDECGGRRCPYHSRCFVYRARRRAAAAHLVIANHSLVIADAVSPGGGILPPHGRLVLDEAHNLEDIATEYLSCEFSLPALTRILNRLARRGRGRKARAGGVLANIERQLQKGVLSASGAAGRTAALLAEASSATVRTLNAAEAVIDTAAALLAPAGGRETCRYRMDPGDGLGDPVRMYSLHGLFKPYSAEEWDETALKARQTDLEAQLAGLVNVLHGLRETLDSATEEGSFNFFSDLSTQVSGIADSLVAFANEAEFTLQGAKDTHAFWIERVRPHGRPSYLRLVASPLSVADDLNKALYEVRDSVVLCSATLRVGNDFKYMARRLGCGERFQALTAESPFDYFRQSLALAVDSLPDPAADSENYARRLAELMKDLFPVTRARALVLFTSYEMMNAVAAHARKPLAECGFTLLVQGEGMSREALARSLRDESGSAVVFGAQSFWEGVDVAGEALSCVVLSRLPFAQVGDPVVEARSEKIDREGGSSFRDYALPEAVIKFRQGFGRLIRTRSDRGVVIVTDPRIVTKNYGATFRKSIPVAFHTVSDTAELLERVGEFLR